MAEAATPAAGASVSAQQATQEQTQTPAVENAAFQPVTTSVAGNMAARLAELNKGLQSAVAEQVTHAQQLTGMIHGLPSQAQKELIGLHPDAQAYVMYMGGLKEEAHAAELARMHGVVGAVKDITPTQSAQITEAFLKHSELEQKAIQAAHEVVGLGGVTGEELQRQVGQVLATARNAYCEQARLTGSWISRVSNAVSRNPKTAALAVVGGVVAAGFVGRMTAHHEASHDAQAHGGGRPV